MQLNIANLKNKWSISVVITSFIIIDLLALYYLKYKNQGIPVSEFSLFNTGNLLNFTFCLILIIGIFIYTKSSKIRYSRGVIIFFTLMMTITLLISEIYTRIRIPLPNIYFFDHPLRDILKGFLFLTYQFTEFLFISIVWLAILGRKELLILRAFVNSVIITLFLLAFAFVYLQSSKGNNFNSITAGKDRYIGVVLGAAVWPGNQPSPSLASRTAKAARLYNEGLLSKIQLTGGHAPGEMSESEVAYNFLKNRYIDTTNIWIEKKTSSTIEQIRFIKKDLIEAKNIKNILIISDGYHLRRVNEICDFYKIRVKVAPSDLKLSFDNNIYYKLRESIALLIFWFFAI